MPVNEESILDSIKKVRGVSPDDESFDEDFVLFINAAFSTLHQYGVGPTTAFYIEDKEAKWADFIGEIPNILLAKAYVAKYVKLEFDPPSNSFGLNAAQEKLKEDAWRLMEACDHSREFTTPITSVTPDPSDPEPTFTTYFTE